MLSFGTSVGAMMACIRAADTIFRGDDMPCGDEEDDDGGGRGELMSAMGDNNPSPACVECTAFGMNTGDASADEDEDEGRADPTVMADVGVISRRRAVCT
jgi:hypothetical protein